MNYVGNSHFTIDLAESSQDSPRSEMPWEDREEQYLSSIMEFCRIRSEKHRYASKIAKRWYLFLSIPTIFTPAVLATIKDTISADTSENLWEKSILMSSAVFAGFSSFLNLGKTSSQHSEYNQKYDELQDLITIELCKPKRFRVQCDVFLERVMQQYHSLNKTAPDFCFF